MSFFGNGNNAEPGLEFVNSCLIYFSLLGSTAWKDRVNQTSQQQPILIPSRINVVQKGVAATEGAPFSQHIAIEMLDANVSKKLKNIETSSSF